MVTKRFVKSGEIEMQAISLAAIIARDLKLAGAFKFDPETGKTIIVDGQVQLTTKIWIISLFQGGCSYGVHVQGALAKAGVKVDHVCIKTSSYTGVAQQSSTTVVHDLSYVTDRFANGDFLVIVDDVFDSGETAKAVVEKIVKKVQVSGGFDCTDAIKVAVGFWKPANSRVEPFKPDFVADTIDSGVWLVFPHEYEDLTDDELRQMIGNEKTEAILAIGAAINQ